MPREPTSDILADVARGEPSARLTPGLRAFLSDDLRREIGQLVEESGAWIWKGCDQVKARRIERLGARIERTCYATVAGEDSRHLVEIAYTAGWRVAAVDWYDY
jgi:hypothetical protein